MKEGLYFKQLAIGPMANYVYLIGDQAERKAVVVDPAWDIDAILAQLDEDDMELVGALARSASRGSYASTRAVAPSRRASTSCWKNGR